MKSLWTCITCIILLTGCNPAVVEPVPEESWKRILPEINDYIRDARVIGDELHLISATTYYRILGEDILDQRALTPSNYQSITSPVIGEELIFRMLNFDTVYYIELQPIREGGNTVRIDVADFGDADLIFPISHTISKVAGVFNNQNDFLFIGFDYPAIQQFVILLEIKYNAATNTIESVTPGERKDIQFPTSFGMDEFARNVFAVDDVFFISSWYSGTYRIQGEEIEFQPELTLPAAIAEGDVFYGTNNSREVIVSTDAGKSWSQTGISLSMGRRIHKAGVYYLQTNEYDQVFGTAKVLGQWNPFVPPIVNGTGLKFVNVLFDSSSYVLIGHAEGSSVIFTRTSLDWQS